MMKIVSRLLLVLLIMLIPGLIPADAATISIVPDTQNAPIGQSFQIDIKAPGAVDLYAFQFDLAFDPLVVKALDVTEGDFLNSPDGSIFIPGTIDNTSGTITYIADSLLSLGPGLTGDLTLATVQFEALSPGTSPLTISNPLFLDSNLNEFSVSPTNGQVVVPEGPPIPEPSTFLLLGGGMLALAIASRRKR